MKQSNQKNVKVGNRRAGNRKNKQQQFGSPSNLARIQKGYNQSMPLPPIPGKMSSAPVSLQRQVRTQRAKISSLKNGDCRIVHREYIGEVVAGAGTPSAFNVNQYSLNPGLQQSFPWLSKIAQNYESYKFNRFQVCYETEAPSSLGGSLVIALDYDALDVAPATKQQALAYRESVRSAPWSPCCHYSLQEDLHKLKSHYVRFGAAPANSDLKTYDAATINIITQGVTTAAATCGEVYFEYDILLMSPLYEPIYSSGSLYNATGAGCATTNVLGTGGVAIGVIGISNALNVVTLTNLQIGEELAVSVWMASASISGALAITATSGLTSKNVLSSTIVTQAEATCFSTFVATAQTATCTIAGLTLDTTPGSSAIVVAGIATAGF